MVAVADGAKLWGLCVYHCFWYGLYVHVYVMEWDMLKAPETVLSLGLLSLKSFEMAMRI